MQKLKHIFGEQEDDFLPPEVVFTLNTDKDTFADWLAEKFLLQYHRKPREALNAATPDGRFSTLVKQLYKPPLLDIQKEYKGFGHVLFELMPISQDRTEIAIAYTNKAFPQMIYVLQTIAITYLESSQSIESYIKKFSEIPLSQLADRHYFTPQIVKKLQELEKELQEMKWQLGQTLTAAQMDIIVQYHLCLNTSLIQGWKFDRVEIDTKIFLYPITVWRAVKSTHVLLGVYRVSEGSDGKGLCGWNLQPYDHDSECERLRKAFHDQVLTPPKPILNTLVLESPEKTPGHKGRYRLTKEEIRQRKKIVKESEKLMAESGNKKTWQQIADELDIPERTLRDWRHNPTYK